MRTSDHEVSVIVVDDIQCDALVGHDFGFGKTVHQEESVVDRELDGHVVAAGGCCAAGTGGHCIPPRWWLSAHGRGLQGGRRAGSRQGSRWEVQVGDT